MQSGCGPSPQPSSSQSDPSLTSLIVLCRIVMSSPKKRMPSVSSPPYTGCVIVLSRNVMLSPCSRAPMLLASFEVKPSTTTLSAVTSIPCDRRCRRLPSR